jgi:predicted metal-dependent phosphoesterase TrpH
VAKVDLHVHSRLSKNFGFNDRVIGNLKNMGLRRGLAGFALTEHIHASDFWGMHNELGRRYTYRDGFYDLGDGFRMFSGAEVTVDERVDFITVGPLDQLRRLDEAFSPRLSDWHFVPALDFLDAARRFELLVISAHPFRPGKETAKLQLDEVFRRVDAVEVNGRDYGTEQRVADLARNYTLPIAGSSDAHYYLQIGIRSTVIPHAEATLGNIRDAFAERQTKAHCKAYAPQVVQLCKEIKTAAKLRKEETASTTAA